ncbi:MAG: SUMF1/EgtB/PvdO family nonheme iron enzyme [Proteobacteria bacterium]|nr:SUMF1/EgtB/PvdO family nonheme iron enzyme [Pseudomonadota bacterium]
MAEHKSALTLAEEKRLTARRSQMRGLLLLVVVIGLGAIIADWVSGDPGLLKPAIHGAGSFEVSSTPQGADVFLDGRTVGRTPFVIPVLLAGTYTLKLSHPHRLDHVDTLVMRRGGNVERTVELGMAFGRLMLVSNPRGAEVKLDEEIIEGETPLALERYPAGLYRAEFTLFGRESVVQQVEVLPGVTAEVLVDLNMKNFSALTVKTDPVWATVKMLEVPVAYAPEVRVPTGEYRIEVSAKGYVTETRTYTLRVGENVVKISLEREMAKLRVTSTPGNAAIWIQGPGDRVERRYESGMDLPTGVVTVRVHQKGYRSTIRKLNLDSAGGQLNVKLSRINVKPGDVLRDPFSDASGFAPEMIVIAEGSATDPTGTDTTQVAEPFAISRYEVAIEDYRRFLTARGKTLRNDKDTEDPKHPISIISWAQAVEYTQWLTAMTGNFYRLPTDAEWSLVAYRGAVVAANVCEQGNIADTVMKKAFNGWQSESCEDGFVRTAPVGSFMPNSLGVYDLVGNVSEWMSECGRSGCDSHVLRGSGWDSSGTDLQLKFRDSSPRAADMRGIRLVRVL